jgi:penicillin-binding protein 1A
MSPISGVAARGRRLLALLLILPIAVGVGLSAWLTHRVWIDRSGAPDIQAFIRFDEPTSSAIYAANGPLLIELARQRREIVDFDQIPPVLREALLAAEDKNFFTHRGVDPAAWPRVLVRNLAAIGRAAKRALTSGERCHVAFRQGGSTITQQLVRGYFLQHVTRRENADVPLSDAWPARLGGRLLGVRAANKLVRKVEELRLALWLEETLAAHVGSRRRAKELIFARYASLIYFGGGRYGIAEASKYYFDKPLDSYTEGDVAEAALLAGIIKSPRDYAPTAANAEAARRRRNDILARMQRSGRLDAKASQRAQTALIEVASPPSPELHAPAAVSSVLAELRQGVGGFGVNDLLHGRVRVHTSIDTPLQRIAEEAVEDGLQRYERRHPARAGTTQAAVVVLRNADAAILAEVGGRQHYDGRAVRYTDYNRARQALRQPGSALKPLVYLTALRAGASLDTLVLDEPIDVQSASPTQVKAIANYDETFRGPIRLREALAESRNAATVWLAREVGMPGILRTAHELGIDTPLQPYLSTALGASEVTLRELANVYRALASGIAARPHVIERMENPRREVVYQTTEHGRPLHMPELRMIQEGLRGVVRLPGGTARALAARGFPVAVIGKTGTSSEFRDALFVGSSYGPDGITVAVWMGRDDHEPLGGGESGARVALPVFRDIMAKAYQPGVRGAAPRLPDSIERGIDAYLSWRAIMADDAAPRPDISGLHAPALGGGRLAFAAARPQVVESARGTWLCANVSGGTVCMPKASAPPSWLSAQPPAPVVNAVWTRTDR